MNYASSVLTSLALASLALAAQAQSAGIGPGGYTPNANAALDISSGTSGNKGLLIPRVTASQRGSFTASAEGMLVYQTDGTQPGFWYYTNNAWVPLPSGVASSAGWLTTGNSGTAPGTFTGVGATTNGTGGTSYLGTTDNVDLVFRTGNAERLRISTNGSLYSRSTFGLILNANDAPMITRGWDTFQTGTYAGLGRWGLFMRASQLAFGIPNTGGKTFAWITWNDDSSLGSTLMTLTQTGNLGLGIAAPTTRLSLVGTGTGAPATANATQSTGQLARLRDNGNVTLDLGSSGTAGNWLQSTNATDLSTNYPLALNPNGGNVGIGTGTAAPTSTLSVGGTLSVAVSLTIAGGASGSATLLGGYNATYLGLMPADNTNNNYLLPDPTTCAGRVYYIRNNSSTQTANLSTVGYTTPTTTGPAKQLYNGSGSAGFQSYGLGPNANGKTIICISDGQNWTIGQLN